MARWFRYGLSVAGSFVCRCLTSHTMLRFHTPAHQTGRAVFPHPAFGSNSSSRLARVPKHTGWTHHTQRVVDVSGGVSALAPRTDAMLMNQPTTNALLHSWATPIVRLLMLFDSGETVRSRPGDAWRVGFQSGRMAPAKGTTKALAKGKLTKLNHMAFGLAVYASSRSLPYATQDSLPAVGQSLPDGLFTRRVTIEGFKFTSCQSSSSAKLLGAIPF